MEKPIETIMVTVMMIFHSLASFSGSFSVFSSSSSSAANSADHIRLPIPRRRESTNANMPRTIGTFPTHFGARLLYGSVFSSMVWSGFLTATE